MGFVHVVLALGEDADSEMRKLLGPHQAFRVFPQKGKRRPGIEALLRDRYAQLRSPDVPVVALLSAAEGTARPRCLRLIEEFPGLTVYEVQDDWIVRYRRRNVLKKVPKLESVLAELQTLSKKKRRSRRSSK
jgi:hypothetical protein